MHDIICPHCGKVPSLLPEHREYVCENNESSHDAIGYYISPFDAPMLQTVPQLIKESTEYKRHSEFVNQGLGLTHLDSEDSLTREDLKKSQVFGNRRAFMPASGMGRYWL